MKGHSLATRGLCYTTYHWQLAIVKSVRTCLQCVYPNRHDNVNTVSPFLTHFPISINVVDVRFVVSALRLPSRLGQQGQREVFQVPCRGVPKFILLLTEFSIFCSFSGAPLRPEQHLENLISGATPNGHSMIPMRDFLVMFEHPVSMCDA